MKSCSLVRAALCVATGLALFLGLAAHAQDTGNIRVVRLSVAEGQVLVSHAGSNVWEDATANLPLQEGDSLATQGGRAEIEFENGATAYLAENSVLQFTQLGYSNGGRATELTLSQGTGDFYANLTSQDSFRVQALTFAVTIPERAEFRVDGFLDGAAVQVYLDEVSVSTSKGSTSLEKGQSVAVHEKDFQNFAIGSLPTAEDAFYQWVTEEGEMIRSGNQNTLSYINSPSLYGLSDLSRYGSWVNVAGFGISWRPFSVGFTWAPYFNGKWILSPNLGWIWVSSEPWGWLPFHFGTWLPSPNLGWIWVPGGPAALRRWEPSRVNWLNVGNQVGWVAKSPNDRDGAPANAATGVITSFGRPPTNRIESNQIVSGKDLRNVTPLKDPPTPSALRVAPPSTHPGASSTIRMAPTLSSNPPNSNPSIVYDHATHTYINRDATIGNNANQLGSAAGAPVAPPALMPRANSGVLPVGNPGKLAERPQGSRAEIPRVTMPLHGPADPRTNRVILPPASQRNIPTNGLSPVRPPVGVPPNTTPRPVSPPPVPPRNVTSPPPPAATPPTAPRPAAPQAGPASRAPQSATPVAPADRR